MGVGVQKCLVGECFGEVMGDPSGVLNGDGCSVSFGSRSGS